MSEIDLFCDIAGIDSEAKATIAADVEKAAKSALDAAKNSLEKDYYDEAYYFLGNYRKINRLHQKLLPRKSRR